VFEIRPIVRADYQSWLRLWQGYLEFYEAQLSAEITELTFDRILKGEIHGVIAVDENGRELGFVHWLTHKSTWADKDVCYLEDLYVSNDARRQGLATALIEHVASWAKQQGIQKTYWLTKENNSQARALYDQLAQRTGFIHYEIVD